MAHRTVGVGTSIGISLGTGTSTNPFNVQSNTIRIYAKGAPCYVAVGNTPSATSESYYIGADKEATLGMTKASNRVTELQLALLLQLILLRELNVHLVLVNM